MRFGRVEGFIAGPGDAADSRLHLTVYLETGPRFEIVRDEWLLPLRPIDGPPDLAWHADQWTQETIGVDLAELGWEVVGAGDEPDVVAGEPVRSRTYAVRNLGPGSG